MKVQNDTQGRIKDRVSTGRHILDDLKSQSIRLRQREENFQTPEKLSKHDVVNAQSHKMRQSLDSDIIKVGGSFGSKRSGSVDAYPGVSIIKPYDGKHKSRRTYSKISKVPPSQGLDEHAIGQQSYSPNQKSNHNRCKSNYDAIQMRDHHQNISPLASNNMGKTVFESSPIGKHFASQEMHGTRHSNSQFNTKLMMRDTFTSVFPTYQHGERSVAKPPHSHLVHQYPPANEDGSPTHVIDRTHTNKLDYLKRYTEEMLKISNIRRATK